MHACVFFVHTYSGWANKMKHRAKTAKDHSPVEPIDIRVHKINTTPRPPLPI